MNTGLARVTISAPQRRVDVALPEQVPLAELLPEVLRHAGEDLADAGERHGGWVLRRADGVTLEVDRGLHPQGVRDGEVLHLRPAHDDWPELEYDDVVEAVAEGARRRGGAWTPATTRTAALIAAGTAFTIGLVALAAADLRGDGAGWAGLGLAVLLALAATTASRAYGAAPAGVVLGGFAMPYAFAGGAALVTSAGRDGVLPGLRWIGGPELLAGSVAVLLAAVLCGAGVATGARVFTAGATVGALGAPAALTGLAGGPEAGAAALFALLVCGISLFPALAIRLGRTPMPPVTLPADPADGPADAALEAIRHRPDREVVFAAVRRTDESLAGLLLGHAVLVAGAAAVLAVTNTLAARILLAAGAIALLLRSRLFRSRRQRLPLAAGGLAAFVAFGADLLGEVDTAALPAVAVGCALLALAVVAGGLTWSDRSPSPYLSRAADLLDVLATVSVIPVACAVAGLYSAVSGIAF
ncbi:type VII secretion integral membrane protein EccD [Actinoplanes regularis]|uniref:Type VII secretion integral membrane protein EccD n=1 Tax=Actinoplanes regularis TaxID=52697 RepID=A0A239APL6_9ACTN|nr:type VII secretion integral membrane protein EccD [Actinoplanes regularis]GIE87443.1 type VII secretion integral membrane protein EccD [Actinoplanes regularis]SNR97605.1 type VII secretion integral membrane protein EccD [Actinoplanes regularis]